MSLQELEKFIFYKGILGCRLDKVPDRLLAQIDDCTALEIVDKSAVKDYPYSINDFEFCYPETYNLEEINNFSEYVLRPKVDAWRELIFLGRPLHSGILAAFISIVVQNPDGVDKKFVKSAVVGSEKNISKWLRNLTELNIISVENKKADEDIIYFNKDLIEGESVNYVPNEESEKIAKLAAKKKDDKKKNMATLEKEKNQKQVKAPKTKLDIIKLMEQAISAIKDHQHGIPIKSLRVWLNINEEEMSALIEKFDSMKGFEVVRVANEPVKIVYKGTKENEMFNFEAVTFLVGMCKTYKIFLLSEQPKELKSFKNSVGISDENLLEIMERNGFKIIEIRYKYMNSDFVIFSSEINENDEELLSIIEKAKNKIARYFKVKVQNIFFRNSFYTIFDNNYSPFLKERVLLLYKFINEQIEKNNDFFTLNSESILEMNFYAFVKVIPLRAEFHFLEIISDIANLESARMGKKYFEGLSSDEIERLNEKCLKIAKNHTLGEILNKLLDGTDCKNNLLSRINIIELDKILLSLVKYNIFEGFSDSKFIYFEAIDGIESYIDRIFQNIIDDGNEAIVYVPYGVRKNLYEKIGEFSPEEFYQKTKEIIEKTFEGSEKDFFMKKLQIFE